MEILSYIKLSLSNFVLSLYAKKNGKKRKKERERKGKEKKRREKSIKIIKKKHQFSAERSNHDFDL